MYQTNQKIIVSGTFRKPTKFRIAKSPMPTLIIWKKLPTKSPIFWYSIPGIFKRLPHASVGLRQSKSLYFSLNGPSMLRFPIPITLVINEKLKVMKKKKKRKTLSSQITLLSMTTIGVSSEKIFKMLTSLRRTITTSAIMCNLLARMNGPYICCSTKLDTPIMLNIRSTMFSTFQ